MVSLYYWLHTQGLYVQFFLHVNALAVSIMLENHIIANVVNSYCLNGIPRWDQEMNLV